MRIEIFLLIILAIYLLIRYKKRDLDGEWKANES